MQRLFIFGLLAAPFFIALKSWLPLNIMFTLLLATYLIYLIERNEGNGCTLFVLAFIIGGAVRRICVAGSSLLPSSMVALQVTELRKGIIVDWHHSNALGGEWKLLGLRRNTYYFYGFIYQA